MKRIVFAIFGRKIYITVLLFYFHFWQFQKWTEIKNGNVYFVKLNLMSNRNADRKR